jgi:DNA repair protein RadC
MNGGTHTAESRVDRPPPHDRPRERLARLGASSLGDHELLALIVAPGTRGQSGLALAAAVLARVGGVAGLSRVALGHLRQVPGLGLARAARLVAAVELGRRALTGPATERPRFIAPRELAAFLMPQFGARPVEHFGVVLLDTKNRLLSTAVISVGTVDGTVVHPRDVFREAAIGGASGIVLFHNHPSGDPTPSSDDGVITRRMVAAGRVMGIEVLDHLVLGEVRYFSFKEERLL